MAPKHRPTDEQPDTADAFLSALRVRALATFISALMVLYSFVGSIYRIPLQMEQHSKEILLMQQTLDKISTRIMDLERINVSHVEGLTESSRTRGRVDALEKASTAQAVVQQQVNRLEEQNKELSKQLDTLSVQITQLGVNVLNLKEGMTETHKTLDEIKRKQ